ncbi:MAG: 6-phosphofructokinase [Verrucomicrobia bacterium]|nr:6-phosphofructokinase [Verrucomicrobiota bacterium]
MIRAVNPDARRQETIAILVGGGPAPGINGVIAAATLEAIEEGRRVLGIYDGFKWLARGDVGHVKELTIEDVSRIHFEGGSILRTARENPTKDPQKMANVLSALRELRVNCLVTIGGDDTAFSASQVAKNANGAIRVVHVPKTIDNDLPLPGLTPTFGYETARSVGAEIIRNLMEDARTTGRWYFVVAMGRHAGHLALGMSKAAGATLCIIPEEFKQPKVTLAEICDVIEGSIIKRRATDRPHGVAVMAEGLASKLTDEDLAQLARKNLASVDRDDHGHMRLSEVNLGKAIRDEVERRFTARKIKLTTVEKVIGYEVRCAPPVPFDCEYTRDLGYAAVKFLAGGGSAAMASIQGGKMVPMYFKDMMDEQGKTKVRFVDTTTESYQVAREYMIRLGPEDFRNDVWVARLAGSGGYTPEEFMRKFGRFAQPS